VRTVEEHQAVVAGLLPLLPEEEVPLTAAGGRVLSRDVSARVSLPGFDNSAMDGYAARSEDVAAATDAPPCASRSPRTSPPVARTSPPWRRAPSRGS
jgi:molybdopterin molybdotransferase